MTFGKESETLEFKKTTGELKEAVISVASILNKTARASEIRLSVMAASLNTQQGMMQGVTQGMMQGMTQGMMQGMTEQKKIKLKCSLNSVLLPEAETRCKQK